MNFPFLDRLPIPSRVRARQLVNQFSDELGKGLLRNRDRKTCSMDSDELGSRLIAARDQGLITEKQFRDNLTVSFVAGQENPQLLLTSTMYLLAKHPVSSDLSFEIGTLILCLASTISAPG